MKEKKRGKLVTLVLTFSCPKDGCKVKSEQSHHQTPGAMRELESTMFAVHCPACKQEYQMKGSERISLELAK